jgi:Flp pilus assembly protein TadG
MSADMVRSLKERVRCHFKQWRRSDSGSIAIWFGLGSTLVIGGMALAIDVTGATMERHKLQGAADSASLAGVKKLSEGGTAGQAETVAADYLAASPLAGITFDQDIHATDAEHVTVSLTSTYPSLARGLLHGGSMDIAVTSTAVYAPSGKPVCIHSLDLTMNKAIDASGGSNFNGPDCTVWVNSSSTSAVNLSGGGSITANKACIHGTVSAGTVTPTPVDCGVRTDPFATKNPTTPAACNFNNFSHGAGTFTMTPGVYCGNVSLSGGPTVTLSPGLYVIRNGKLSMSGGGSMTGAGVTLLFEGTSELNLSGGGSYHLSAPTTGELKGFVIFQRPTANPGKPAVMSGSGQMYFEGVIYMPTWTANVSGTGSVGTPSPFSAYIAKNFTYSGGSTVQIHYNPANVTVPIPRELFTEFTVYLSG